MAIPNPVETFTRGFNHWWVWLIFITIMILWLIRVDRDMKKRNGEGLFENLFDWE